MNEEACANKFPGRDVEAACQLPKNHDSHHMWRSGDNFCIWTDKGKIVAMKNG